MTTPQINKHFIITNSNDESIPVFYATKDKILCILFEDQIPFTEMFKFYTKNNLARKILIHNKTKDIEFGYDSRPFLSFVTPKTRAKSTTKNINCLFDGLPTEYTLPTPFRDLFLFKPITFNYVTTTDPTTSTYEITTPFISLLPPTNG
nr:hypothetical protein [Abalone asfa-like virus]